MQASHPSQRRNANLALALLLAINLFNYLDRYILAAVEPLISDHFFGANDGSAMAKTGALATAFLLSYMALAPVFGWLADRFSRWTIVAFGVGFWSLASGASGLASTFLMLVLTRVMVGAGEAAYGPAAPSIISDIFPVAKRGQMLSLFYVAIPVGSAIGYAFGGAIGQRFGWRMPFYLVTLPGLVLAGLSLLLRDPRAHAPAPTHEPEKPKITLSRVLALFRIRSYVMNTAAMAAMTFAIGGLSFWVPRYLFKYRAADFGGHPDLGHINFTFGAITATAGLIATIAGGWAGDFVRRKYASAYFLVSGCSMFFAFPATYLMLHTPFPHAWTLVFLAIFFLFANTGPANAALANVTPPGIRSTAFAVNIFIIHIFGDAISPPLLGWISDRTNMNFAFLIVSITMAIASVFWLVGARDLARDTAAIAEAEAPNGAGAPPHG